MRSLCLLLFLLLFSTFPLSSWSQESTFSDSENQLSLQADRLIYNDDDSTIIARGNVQLDYQGRNVRADEVIYDQLHRRVKAKGSVELTDPDGSRLNADELDLTDDFSAGFISSLRVETRNKTYFSADRAEQLDGSTIFHDGIYTACERCADKPEKPVTWQVKASKIMVNGVERTISYEDARFELFGVPIIYVPYFRHGDPSQSRKDGFLVPDIRFDDDLGTSYHQSYFKTLGDSADITLSLASYSNQGFLGEGVLRRKYDNGDITITAAGIEQQQANRFSRAPDSNVDDRGLLATKGDFSLTDRWKTGWDILFQTDDSFGNTYSIDGYSAVNVTSEAYLRGLGDRSSFSLSGYYYDVQGSNYQVEDQQAFIHPVLDYHYETATPNVGGELQFDMNIMSLSRNDENYTPLLVDGIPLMVDGSVVKGRVHGISGEINRVSANLNWHRTDIIGGFTLTPTLGLYGDTVQFTNNNTTNYEIDKANESRFLPKASIELSYPLLIEGTSSTHILEPIGQLIARPDLDSPTRLPNEDSQSLVFDATSLFQHDKFSGYDRIESGSRANYGFRYSGTFNDGLNLTGLLGQSYHISGDNPYQQLDLVKAGSESGLESDRTDYVGSIGASLPDFRLSPSLHFQGRFNKDDFRPERMESLFSSGTDSWSLAAQYAYIDGQPLSGFAETREQLSASGVIRLGGNWRLFGSTSFDIENDGFISDKYGIGFDDSCLDFSLTFSQTHDLYTATENEKSIGFKVRIRALGIFRGDDDTNSL